MSDSARRIVIGTRGSALALVQAGIVEAALRAADPSLVIETRVITTRGDTDQKPIPLDVNGKGWFTVEIEAALHDGTIDLAVHSLKDMAAESPEGLCIGAYLAREDARDALITEASGSASVHEGGDASALEHLPVAAVIGTDSARRQVQMLALKPDAVMQSLRGNVPTRIEKLAAGPYDAIILAAAGLKRLGLESKVARYFDMREMTPAPGQGILAVQARDADDELLALLSRITHEETARAAMIERAFSLAIGGGCKSPTGAYAVKEAGGWRLIGMIAKDGDANGNADGNGQAGAGRRVRIVRDEAFVATNDEPGSDGARAVSGMGEALAKRLLAA